MAQAYSIYAYSPSLNQKHREIQLNGEHITDPRLAQQRATSFAQIYNRDRKQHVEDWVGLAEWETYGVESIPGYLFHKGR